MPCSAYFDRATLIFTQPEYVPPTFEEHNFPVLVVRGYVLVIFTSVSGHYIMQCAYMSLAAFVDKRSFRLSFDDLLNCPL